MSRTLTPSEDEQMRRQMSQARAMNESRRAIVNLGLWNYPPIPALIVFMCYSLRKTRTRMGRCAASGLLFLGVVFADLMFYRGYFTSLGW